MTTIFDVVFVDMFDKDNKSLTFLYEYNDNGEIVEIGSSTLVHWQPNNPEYVLNAVADFILKMYPYNGERFGKITFNIETNEDQDEAYLVEA